MFPTCHFGFKAGVRVQLALHFYVYSRSALLVDVAGSLRAERGQQSVLARDGRPRGRDGCDSTGRVCQDVERVRQVLGDLLPLSLKHI